MLKPLMRKYLLLSLVFMAAVGCGPSKVTRLAPAAFIKHFAKVNVPTDTQTNSTAVASKPKLITPGMVVTVSVAEDQSLNKQYMVPPSGLIDVAGAGRITVVGLTADEVAQKIREPLERDYFQKATVDVTIEAMPTGGAPGSTGGGVIYVLGSVNRPGPLLLPPNEVFTVTKAIIAAGGFGTFSMGSRVRLIRYDENAHKYETVINVLRIMKEGNFEDDIPVQNGDWIIVPEKWINF
jgi:polysaccharide export outer membrane protein